MFAIRSERRLCAEVQVNLAYRWFCKLGIEDKIPDHSVFCRARHERFRESDALRRVFEGVVAMCIASGLVGGEAFSVDASLIKADVDKKKRIPGEQPISWPKPEEASRAVRGSFAWSHEISRRMCATASGRWPTPRPSGSHAASAKRSRCDLRT